METIETLCIRITKHCNLSCIHCRAGSSPFTKEYIDIDKLYVKLVELRKIGLRHISISGGEPFLVQNLVPFITQLINSNFNVTVTSNGTLPRVKEILESEIKNSKKLKIRFSLDGDKKQNDEIRGIGVFDKCINSISKVQEIGNPPSLNTVVYKWNYDSIKQLIQNFDYSLIGEWAFISPVQKGTGKDIEMNKEIYPKLLDECESQLISNGFKGKVKKWDFVNTPYSSALMNANGDIVLTGIEEGQDLFLTNIFDKFNILELQEMIDSQKNKLERQYFNWTKW